jgi:hypothetical protein
MITMNRTGQDCVPVTHARRYAQFGASQVTSGLRSWERQEIDTRSKDPAVGVSPRTPLWGRIAEEGHPDGGQYATHFG